MIIINEYAPRFVEIRCKNWIAYSIFSCVLVILFFSYLWFSLYSSKSTFLNSNASPFNSLHTTAHNVHNCYVFCFLQPKRTNLRLGKTSLNRFFLESFQIPTNAYERTNKLHRDDLVYPRKKKNNRCFFSCFPPLSLSLTFSKLGYYFTFAHVNVLEILTYPLITLTTCCVISVNGSWIALHGVFLFYVFISVNVYNTIFKTFFIFSSFLP